MRVLLLASAFVLAISASSFGDIVNVAAQPNAVAGLFVDSALATTQGSFLITTSSNQAGDGIVTSTQLGTANGAQGIEVTTRSEDNQPNGTTEIVTYDFNVIASSGFELDTITISQSPYTSDGTNGGFVDTNVPTLALSGVDLGDVTASDPSNQLTPLSQIGGAGTPISFQASNAGTRLIHSLDAWELLLNNVSSGSTISLISTIAGGFDPAHINEIFAFNATFVPVEESEVEAVPEPGSAVMLGLLGLVFLGRRSRN